MSDLSLLILIALQIVVTIAAVAGMVMAKEALIAARAAQKIAEEANSRSLGAAELAKSAHYIASSLKEEKVR